METNLHVDPDLWRALRVRVIEEGTTATELRNRIIAAHVAQNVLAAPRPKETAPKRRA